MKPSGMVVMWGVAVMIFAPQWVNARAQSSPESDKFCEAKLHTLGADPNSFEYFCARKIDYQCLEAKVYGGQMSASEALPLCTDLKSEDSIIVTKSTLSEDGDPKRVRSELNVWSGPNLILGIGVFGLVDLEKRCVRGPIVDDDGHKVFGHGLGNALGTALIGWAANNCQAGAGVMTVVSGLREQQKISRDANCEWSSIGWDIAGITSGGAACAWINEHASHPEFLQAAAEKLLGKRSGVTLSPHEVLLNKSF